MVSTWRNKKGWSVISPRESRFDDGGDGDSDGGGGGGGSKGVRARAREKRAKVAAEEGTVRDY